MWRAKGSLDVQICKIAKINTIGAFQSKVSEFIRPISGTFCRISGRFPQWLHGFGTYKSRPFCMRATAWRFQETVTQLVHGKCQQGHARIECTLGQIAHC